MIPTLLPLLLVSPVLQDTPGQADSRGVATPQVPEMVFSFDVYAELADHDRDGAVTGEEWEGFFAHCAPLAPCVLVFELQAELVFQGLDRDDVREWTLKDITESLGSLDVNGDGTIERDEPTNTEMTRGSRGTRGYIHRLANSLLLEEADRNADGRVDAAERSAVIADWSADSNPIKAVKRWIAAAKKREPGDRNFMSPGVSFLTMESELDMDRDGCCDNDRLNGWFKALDSDGDGVLQSAERRVRRQRGESWRRITDERRALPPLMPWQRSLDDAQRVQRRTGQPLLICVNMDGETACDSLAYWRYRDPEFAALAAGFVCLVVSPDEHRPRDYDDRGRRMASPRLGRVTNSEHIDAEPELYARYFNGRRVAPRHVGVSPEGDVLFDIFLTNDAERVDRALIEFGRPAAPISFADLSDAELASLPDAEARAAFEARMVSANPQRKLALAAHTGRQLDAGMIALRGDDPAVRAAAAEAMARATRGMTETHARAVMLELSSLDAASQRTVRDGLERAGESLPGLRFSLTALEAAERGSRIGAVAAWGAAADLAPPMAMPSPDRSTALEALERVDAAMAAPGAPDDLRLLRAQALFHLASALIAQQEDPRDAASEAIVAARGVPARDRVRAEAIVACCAALSGDWSESVRAAHFALPEMWSAQSDPLTVQTLRALLAASAQSVYADQAAGAPVRASRIADSLLAGRTLLRHPAGTEADALALLRLLEAVRDVTSVPTVLTEAVLRFPYSAELHRWFRSQALNDLGAEGVAQRYAQLRRSARDSNAQPTLLWFEGLARFLAAEWCVQQGRSEDALDAYDASTDCFLASVEAAGGFADTAYHYVVLAQAGAMTLEAERGDLEAAAPRAKSVSTLRPGSLDQVDGLGRSPRARLEAVLPRLPEDARKVVTEALGETDQ